VQVD